MYDNNMVLEVSKGVSNFIYKDNIQATKEMMNVFDKISRRKLNITDDYIEMYDNNFYTYENWEKLVESEKDQTDGLSENELLKELNDEKFGSIWKLPCGWYLQYV